MKLSFILTISSLLTLIIWNDEVFSSPVEYIYHHNNNYDVFNTPHHVFHHEYDGYNDHHNHDNDHHYNPPPTVDCSLYVNTYPSNVDVYTGPNTQPRYNNPQPTHTSPSYSPNRNYNYNPRNPTYPTRRYAYQGVGSRTSNNYVPRNHQPQYTQTTGSSLVSGGRYYGNSGNTNYYGGNYGANYGYKK